MVIYNYNHMYINVIYHLKFNITLLIYSQGEEKSSPGAPKFIYMLVIFISNC